MWALQVCVSSLAVLTAKIWKKYCNTTAFGWKVSKQDIFWSNSTTLKFGLWIISQVPRNSIVYRVRIRFLMMSAERLSLCLPLAISVSDILMLMSGILTIRILLINVVTFSNHDSGIFYMEFLFFPIILCTFDYRLRYSHSRKLKNTFGFLLTYLYLCAW